MRALKSLSMVVSLAVALTALLATPAVAQAPNAKAQELLQRFDAEPNVNQVQRAALDYAQLHPEIFDNMRSRTRTRGLLPQVTIRVTQDSDDVNRGVTSFSLDDTNRSLAEKVSATETKYELLQLTGQARWELGDLVFSRNEPAVVRENRFAAKERQKLLQLVTQLYFERRRAQLDLLLSPPAEAGARALAELKIAQLTAELDALSGGRFSRMITGEK